MYKVPLSTRVDAEKKKKDKIVREQPQLIMKSSNPFAHKVVKCVKDRTAC